MMTYPKAPKIAFGRTLLVLFSAAAFAVPAHAGDDQPKPVTDKSVTAGDVVATPAEDLNLKKQQIPDILIKAQQDPYDMTGLRKCGKITAEIDSLNQTLGPDYDLALNDADKMSVGSVAKSVVGAFIPFRGVIREISGANKRQQDKIWRERQLQAKKLQEAKRQQQLLIDKNRKIAQQRLVLKQKQAKKLQEKQRNEQRKIARQKLEQEQLEKKRKEEQLRQERKREEERKRQEREQQERRRREGR